LTSVALTQEVGVGRRILHSTFNLALTRKFLLHFYVDLVRSSQAQDIEKIERGPLLCGITRRNCPVSRADLRPFVKDFSSLVDLDKKTPDADPFFIALAISKDWTVFTSEKPSTGGRPKIPDVCKKYNMKCISLLEFFRE
jgi:hypothetical protein